MKICISGENTNKINEYNAEFIHSFSILEGSHWEILLYLSNNLIYNYNKFNSTLYVWLFVFYVSNKWFENKISYHNFKVFNCLLIFTQIKKLIYYENYIDKSDILQLLCIIFYEDRF